MNEIEDEIAKDVEYDASNAFGRAWFTLFNYAQPKQSWIEEERRDHSLDMLRISNDTFVDPNGFLRIDIDDSTPLVVPKPMRYTTFLDLHGMSHDNTNAMINKAK